MGLYDARRYANDWPTRASPLGAMGVGRAILMAVVISGIGILLGLDTVVARAFGAENRDECKRWLVQGVHLAWMVAIPSVLLVGAITALMPRFGMSPGVVEHGQPYLYASMASIPSLLLYTAFRRYLQAINRVKVVMIALLTANVVNIAFNYLFIFGSWGMPRLGAAGVGIATVGATTYLALFLGLAAWRESRPDDIGGSLGINFSRMRSLTRLGVPAAVQLALEVGVFGLATVLAGWFAASALAAHQIAITLASTTFMVPMGIAAAGAVRVGQAIGRRDLNGTVQAGWVALFLGASFMFIAGGVFVFAPRFLIQLFTSDPEVIEFGRKLLLVAGVFQLFDGIQVVAIGILRGVGDTRTAMIWSLITHWGIGLPLGAYLAFRAGWGVTGIWTGLCVSLILISIVLFRKWRLHIRHFEQHGVESLPAIH